MWTLMLLGCGLFAGPSESAVPGPEPVGAIVLPPDLPSEPRLSASHVLVAWAGAVQAPPSVTRSEEEARALAESLRARASTEAFEDLARAHSDDPSGRRGGRLGVWRTGTMVPEFERAVASVPAGELAANVRTPFGWHVVRRDGIEEVHVAHIQVAFQGALRATTTRSRAEARARIEAVAQRLRDGEDFASLVAEISDDTGAGPTGDLGVLARGQMVPTFDDAAFALSPGAISEVFETPYGFHVARRLP